MNNFGIRLYDYIVWLLFSTANLFFVHDLYFRNIKILTEFKSDVIVYITFYILTYVAYKYRNLALEEYEE